MLIYIQSKDRIVLLAVLLSPSSCDESQIDNITLITDVVINYQLITFLFYFRLTQYYEHI